MTRRRPVAAMAAVLAVACLVALGGVAASGVGSDIALVETHFALRGAVSPLCAGSAGAHSTSCCGATVCPFTSGVCCANGNGCCPKGSVCLPTKKGERALCGSRAGVPLDTFKVIDPGCSCRAPPPCTNSVCPPAPTCHCKDPEPPKACPCNVEKEEAKGAGGDAKGTKKEEKEKKKEEEDGGADGDEKEAPSNKKRTSACGCGEGQSGVGAVKVEALAVVHRRSANDSSKLQPRQYFEAVDVDAPPADDDEREKRRLAVEAAEAEEPREITAYEDQDASMDSELRPPRPGSVEIVPSPVDRMKDYWVKLCGCVPDVSAHGSPGGKESGAAGEEEEEEAPKLGTATKPVLDKDGNAHWAESIYHSVTNDMVGHFVYPDQCPCTPPEHAPPHPGKNGHGDPSGEGCCADPQTPSECCAALQRRKRPPVVAFTEPAPTVPLKAAIARDKPLRVSAGDVAQAWQDARNAQGELASVQAQLHGLTSLIELSSTTQRRSRVPLRLLGGGGGGGGSGTGEAVLKLPSTPVQDIDREPLVFSEAGAAMEAQARADEERRKLLEAPTIVAEKLPSLGEMMSEHNAVISSAPPTVGTDRELFTGPNVSPVFSPFVLGDGSGSEPDGLGGRKSAGLDAATIASVGHKTVPYKAVAELDDDWSHEPDLEHDYKPEEAARLKQRSWEEKAENEYRLMSLRKGIHEVETNVVPALAKLKARYTPFKLHAWDLYKPIK